MADTTLSWSNSLGRRRWLILGLLVTAFAAFDLLVYPFRDGTESEYLLLLSLGGIWVQPVLIGVWTTLGPTPASLRIPFSLVALVTVLLAVSIRHWLLSNSTSPAIRLGMRDFAMPVVLFAGAIILMLPLRRWMHLRIAAVDTAAGHALPANQFSLRYLLGLTTICAVLLGLGRALASGIVWQNSTLWQNEISEVFQRVGLISLAMFPAFVVPLLALSARPAIRVLFAVPVLWGAITWLAVETVVAIHSPPRSEVLKQIAFLQIGAAATGLASAIVVRFAGYRLRVMTSKSTSNLPAAS